MSHYHNNDILLEQYTHTDYISAIGSVSAQMQQMNGIQMIYQSS